MIFLKTLDVLSEFQTPLLRCIFLASNRKPPTSADQAPRIGAKAKLTEYIKPILKRQRLAFNITSITRNQDYVFLTLKLSFQNFGLQEYAFFLPAGSRGCYN